MLPLRLSFLKRENYPKAVQESEISTLRTVELRFLYDAEVYNVGVYP